MNRFNLLLLTLALTACGQNPVIEGEVNPLLVQAVLNPDNHMQTVRISEATNVVKSDGLSLGDLELPISGAFVQVRGGGQSVLFSEVAAGVYRDTETKLQVTPGETYELQVNDGGGRAVSARTTVPIRPVLTSPGDQAVFPESTPVEFVWQKNKDEDFYIFGELIPECSEINTDISAFNPLRFLHSDRTTIAFRPWFNCAPEEARIMNLRIFAVDPAAGGFLWPGPSGFGRDGQQASNIRDGVGVFGSMAADSVTIFIGTNGDAGESSTQRFSQHN